MRYIKDTWLIHEWHRYGISLWVFVQLDVSRVKYQVKNESRNFISTCVLVSNHVLFCLNILMRTFLMSSTISEHFPKIFENSPKVVWRPDHHFQTFSKNFQRLPKISKFLLKDYVTIAIVIFSLAKMTFSLVKKHVILSLQWRHHFLKFKIKSHQNYYLHQE